MGLEFVDPYGPIPSDLPVPVDDGACRHLPGLTMPSISLRSTKKGLVDLSLVSRRGKTIVFFFPAAGRPGLPDPDGWSLIPGARGCTPQLCDYRETNSEFQKLGARVFGVSSQPFDDLFEIRQRNRLPYDLLSDEELRLATSLRLPTFHVEHPVGLVPPVCIKRLTLVLDSGKIEKVFYPVFPPNTNASQVLAYLSQSNPK